MDVVIGSDHAGYDLKEALKRQVEALGHTVIDVGAHSAEPSDYPDFAESLGEAVAGQAGRRGILICGSGVGASVAANKIPGVRAAICHDCYSARQGVEHDDMNVLTLGARVIGIDLAHDLVSIFLSARFSGEERHARRLGKIKALEQRYLRAAE